jgi:hypothetical protein
MIATKMVQKEKQWELFNQINGNCPKFKGKTQN